MASIIERIEALLQPALTDMGLELVDLEYRREGRGWVLRLFIDKPGGVTLDDCADASREVGGLLDVEDLIPNAYQLEVSSPGINRPLKKEQDFERFAGHLVKVKTYQSLDPDHRGYQRKTFVGELRGLVDGCVVVVQNDPRGGEVQLPLADVAAAHLEFEF